MLTKEQVNERMSNKLEAKLFYAYNNLEEIVLMLDGVIPSKMDVDALMNMKMVALNNIQVYTRMFDLVELSY
tara:strand:+ start:47 stop:262 length:216 start_codon:yes stop_codon:yes gene_type:complete